MVQSAAQEKVDPRLVEAIIFNESRWVAGAFHAESNGTCSVGLGQINVVDCDPAKMAALRDPVVNIRRVAAHLAAIKKFCPKVRPYKKCVRRGWIGLYNPGDPTYARRVLRRAQQRAHRH